MTVGLRSCVVWWKAEYCDNAGGESIWLNYAFALKIASLSCPRCIMKYHPLSWLYIYAPTALGVEASVCLKSVCEPLSEELIKSVCLNLKISPAAITVHLLHQRRWIKHFFALHKYLGRITSEVTPRMWIKTVSVNGSSFLFIYYLFKFFGGFLLLGY